MNKLYYLGNAEYLKHDENFELPHVIEKDIHNFMELNYNPVNMKVPHKTLLNIYLCVFEGRGLILCNPIRTDSFFFFNVNGQTLQNLLTQQSDQDCIGDLNLFLIAFKEVNKLEKLF